MDKNTVGIKNANSLIRAGKIDKTSSWSFTAADGNKLLGPGKDWKEYRKWFLAVDPTEKPETKAYYKFPFGKNGKIYRKGVIAAKQRAAQQGYDNIVAVADNLLKKIDSVDNSWFKMEAKEDGLEVNIYGTIGWEVEAKEFIQELQERKPEKVKLRINSPGGSVFDGIAIYNYLSGADFDVDVWIDGLAASAASVIACSGYVHMPENTFFMIHNPTSMVAGESEDMRKQAEVMDKLRDGIASIYATKTGLDREELLEMIDNETWLSASEAKEKGFCDEVVGAVDNFVVFDIAGTYKNVPKEYNKETEMDYKELYESLLNAIGAEDFDAAKAKIEQKFVDEPMDDVPEEIQNKLREYEDKIRALETSNYVKSIENRVGSEMAMLMGKIKGSVDGEVLEELVAKIEGLKKAVDDLGGAVGETGVGAEELSRTTDDVVNKKLAEIKNELGLKSDVDALVELAKREPELVANWR